MKNSLLPFIGPAFLALGLAACTEPDVELSAPAPKTITRIFDVEESDSPQSRTAVNPNGTISFTASETMSAFVWSGTTSANPGVATRTVVDNVPQIAVTHDEIPGAQSYNYVFVSPQANSSTIDSDFTTLTVHLNATQSPTADSFDPAQDVLVSRKESVSAAGTSTTLPSVGFKRMFTFFRLTLDKTQLAAKGITFGANEKIRTVTLTAPEGTILAGTAAVPVSGDYTLSVPDFTGQTTSNSVTADYGEGAEFTGDAFNVWLVVNPAQLPGLELQIVTTAQTITQKIENFSFSILPDKINSLTLQGVNSSNIVTTVSVNSYFVHGVEIDGVVYGGGNEGATLVPASEAATPLNLGSGIVRFLDSGADNTKFETTAENKYITNNLVLIGNNPDKKTGLELKNRIHLRNAAGIVAFKNLAINTLESTFDQIFTVSGENTGVGTLLFEDCDITFGNGKPLFAPYTSGSGVPAAYIGNIIFRNCKLRYETNSTSNYALFNIDARITTGLSNFRTLVFENNVIYTPSASASVIPAVSLFSQASATTETTNFLSNLAITFDHNTVGNVIGSGSGIPGSAYFIVGQYASLSFTNNLIFNDLEKYPAIMRVGYNYQTWPNNTFEHNFATTRLTVKGFYDGSGSYLPAASIRIYNTADVFSNYDLSTGSFTPAETYSLYGSSLR